MRAQLPSEIKQDDAPHLFGPLHASSQTPCTKFGVSNQVKKEVKDLAAFLKCPHDQDPPDHLEYHSTLCQAWPVDSGNHLARGTALLFTVFSSISRIPLRDSTAHNYYTETAL